MAVYQVYISCFCVYKTSLYESLLNSYWNIQEYKFKYVFVILEK